MESDVVRVCLIIGGALILYGAVRLGIGIYKAEKKIKSLDNKENEREGEPDDY